MMRRILTVLIFCLAWAQAALYFQLTADSTGLLILNRDSDTILTLSANDTIGVTNPAGTVIWWYGDSAAWPAGYRLCNGTNYYLTGPADSALTPDLLDKFPVGANGDSTGHPTSTIAGTEQTTGGSTSYTPAGSVSTHATGYPPPHFQPDVTPSGFSYANHTFTGAADTLVMPFVALWPLIKSY